MWMGSESFKIVKLADQLDIIYGECKYFSLFTLKPHTIFTIAVDKKAK